MSDPATAGPPPIVTEEPTEIAPGVFVIPDGRVPLVPNIGIVVGDRAALVVDTGMGPRSGATVLEHARRLADGKPLFLTITHFHPEHGFGAQVFFDKATIIYNAAQRDDLRAKGPGYLEMFKGFGDAVAEQLEGVELVMPHVVYDGPSAEIDLGGRTVRLLTWGLAHTAGDQIVLLPDDSILFGGDLFETRMFPIVPYFPPDDTDVNGERWIEVLGKIMALDSETVVPGHGEVSGAGLVGAVRDYLVELRNEVETAKRSGLSAEGVVESVGPKVRERYADWDNPEWVDFGIRCFYDQAS
ncbi:MAG: MBL fold metallo-hydrolase [Gaiellales bacterium]